jgi:4-amino-4-deoxy-L-arabinose transferase-like glycosyltransferase
VLALAVAVRLVFLDHTPHIDELNHVLAARALLADGTLSIEGGTPYARAWIYTYLVAGMFRVFGESLVVARLPALFFGSVLVLGLFLWVRAEVGRSGAWLAALLLTFAPISLQMSQWVRFYTLHALVFFAACMLVYRAFSEPLPRGRNRVVLILAACLALAFAFHLQITTVIGILGITLWAGSMSIREAWQRLPHRKQRYRLGVALGILLVGVTAYLIFSGIVRWAILAAMYADAWADPFRGLFRFYHFIMVDQYPALWTLLPLGVLLAAAAQPRAATFAASVFGVAFLLHSLTAWKSERYLFYALPMFFAIWGIAVGSILPILWRRTRKLLTRFAARPLPLRIERSVIASAFVGIALFAAGGSGAASYSYKMLTIPDAQWDWNLHSIAPYRGEPDWVAAGQRLSADLGEVEVVLASHDLAALYGFGRLDYLLMQLIRRNEPLPEFSRARRVPLPAISRVESLERIMSCHASGLVAVKQHHWRRDGRASEAVADHLETHATRLPLPAGWGLHVFRWHHEPSRSADCAALPSSGAARGAAS